MKLLEHFQIPLHNPVLIFALVLLVILLAPLVLKRFKIPGIVGLILAGVILGPHGTNLLERDSSILLFGTVGLLYIVFIAGLELDLGEFRRNKHKSIVFGILTFSVPFSIGLLIFRFLLGYELLPSILISLMFATHTLVSYPIISRLGIAKNRAVTSAIGGTIITDTIVLLLLGIVINSAKGELTYWYWIELIISLIIYSFIVFYILPKLARWFFQKVEGEKTSQYIFVLAVVFMTAFLAELAGIEPIIGAFLAGLVLNRLIPNSSLLMNRIEFTGNAIFIPFFLIYVGMLVNFKVFQSGYDAIIIAAILIATAISTKWLASFFTQILFKYKKEERQLLFGLSTSRAAATIAVILIGFKLEILDDNVLNGTILLILVTCVVSSFVTENAGRKIAIKEAQKPIVVQNIPQRILVPFSNPDNMEYLINLAIQLRDVQSNEAIYPLSVVMDDSTSVETIMTNYQKLGTIIQEANAVDVRVHIVTRVDTSIPNGISRAIKEMMITCVIVGWSGRARKSEEIYGAYLRNLLNVTDTMLLVSKIIFPVQISRNIVVVVPENAELEIGFEKWALMISSLSNRIGSKLQFFGYEHAIAKLTLLIKTSKPNTEAEFYTVSNADECLLKINTSNSKDLIVIIHSRLKSISHNAKFDNTIKRIVKNNKENNIIILYPEQNPILAHETISNYDILDSSLINENINLISKLSNIIRKNKN